MNRQISSPLWSIPFVFSILTFSSFTWAHRPKDGHLYVTAGPLLFQNHAVDHKLKSTPHTGLGVLVEGDVNSWGGLEVSIFGLHRRFSIKEDDMIVGERVKRVDINLGYRVWFTSRFSAGLSFFSSYPLGDPDFTRNEFINRDPPRTSAHDTTDYGFDGSIQIEPWREDRWSAVMDLRYSYSVTPKEREDMNYFGVLFGLKYLVQAREKLPD